MLEKYSSFREIEYTINAVELIKEAILHDLDYEEKRIALLYLQKSNQKDPVVKALRNLLISIDSIDVPCTGIITRMKEKASIYYHWFISKKWFTQGMVYFFILTSLANLAEALFNISTGISFYESGQFLSSALSGLFVMLGIYYMRNRRILAYEMFKRSVTVTIFLTQFFIFYKQQLWALIGLAGNILVFLVVQYLIDQERIFHDKNKMRYL